MKRVPKKLIKVMKKINKTFIQMINKINMMKIKIKIRNYMQALNKISMKII